MTESYSLGEVAAYFSKAAKACGMNWGFMEEAGRTARDLAELGLPGPELLFAHLTTLRGQCHADHLPDMNLTPWLSRSGRLCPIATAVSVTDAWSVGGQATDLQLKGVAYPLLMVPQLWLWVRSRQYPVSVNWQGVEVVILSDGIATDADDSLFCSFADRVQLTGTGSRQATLRPHITRYAVDEEVWKQVVSMAFETFVPASEASRRGAGVGMLDNDE